MKAHFCYQKYATFRYHGIEGSQNASWREGVDFVNAAYTKIAQSNTGEYYKDGDSYIPVSTYDPNNDGEIDSYPTPSNRYNLIYETVVFKISSISDSGEVTGTSFGNITQSEMQGKEIVLLAYPTCFSNPYTVSVSGAQDNNYYVAEKTYAKDSTEGDVEEVPVFNARFLITSLLVT